MPLINRQHEYEAETRARFEKLEADMRRSDEATWRALNEHLASHGHPGAMADLEKLSERITSAQGDIRRESEARTLLDDNRKREMDHLWHEVEGLMRDEQRQRAMRCTAKG